MKTDQSIRICGDYEMTINRCSKSDNYTFPRIGDLYASLGGGVSCTYLNLESAYLQISLDEDTKDYLTINTHRGSYRFHCLRYDVKLYTGIYERAMDCLFAAEECVTVYQDDILVISRTDAENLANVEKSAEEGR